MQLLLNDDDITGLADDDLRSLIQCRVDEYRDCVDHFSELVRFIVVEPDDDHTELDTELGFSISPDRADAFRPWDARDEHDNWIELVYVLSDDGSGVIVFVPRTSPLHADPACPSP